MHKVFSLLFSTCLIVSISGCYHAQIVTGKEPSNKVVEKKWFLGFVNGLVIPEELDVAQECPAGVAKVETKLSFLNQLVTFLTGGIFSPMTVQVTCAAGVGSAEATVLQGQEFGQVLCGAAHNRSLAAFL